MPNIVVLSHRGAMDANLHADDPRSKMLFVNVTPLVESLVGLPSSVVRVSLLPADWLPVAESTRSYAVYAHDTQQPIVETFVCSQCGESVSGSLFHSCGVCAKCCFGNASQCEGCRRYVCSSYGSCDACGNCSQCCTNESCNNCGASVCGDHYCNECEACEACCTCRGRARRGRGDDRGYGLQSYSLDVTEVTEAKPTGVRTYGIELEVNACSHRAFTDILDAIDDESNGLRTRWVPKSDGSLSENGIEIVSAPMSYADLCQAIRDLFEKTGLESRISRDTRCGTHVHVGRDTVAPRTIARTWYPWSYAVKGFGRHFGTTIAARTESKTQREQMQRVLRGLAGRAQNGYCAWSSRAPVNFAERCASHNDHYAAVSCSSHYPTYEFRMFAGSTKLRSALRFLQTVDMLLSISEETQGMEVLQNHESFLREIGKRISRYPELNNTARLTSAYLAKFYPIIESGKSVAVKKASKDAQESSLVPVLKKALQYKRPGIDVPRIGNTVSHRDGLRMLTRAERAVKAKVLA